MQNHFDFEYKMLNSLQKEAVDTIDGPVMVVAGPGTGKTQVLSLRIANILKKTDTNATDILCLTFTNSGVSAMQKRLFKIIGQDALKVRISTFHSFAKDILDKHYSILGFSSSPDFIDEQMSISIFDHIFENNDWEHFKKNYNISKTFNDIKSLINLLKRESVSANDFASFIQFEIDEISTNPESIAKTGKNKGSLKKEEIKKIESLEKTKEIVKFYEIYEEYKKHHNYIDYEDVLILLNQIASESDDVVSDIRENFLYILVDEHQDSSGLQNSFLKLVWGEVEKPNIFVVGDDRQLIYGFGGASLEYFESFKTYFGKAKLIVLNENYRSTQNILDLADSLLQSSITKSKLNSNSPGSERVKIFEAESFRDEIFLAGINIKNQINTGTKPKDIAVLLPKNYQVRQAVRILKDMGLVVDNSQKEDFFSLPETDIFLKIFNIILDPFDKNGISIFLFSRYSGCEVFDVHNFLFENRNTLEKPKNPFSIETLLGYKTTNINDLFNDTNTINKSGMLLKDIISKSQEKDVYELVQYIGEKVFLDRVDNHEDLVRNVEVIRTFLNLLNNLENSHKNISLNDFVNYIERLKNYGHILPVESIGQNEGLKVMTMHSSKGLEFDYVWIAHMDQNSLSKSQSFSFTLPSKIQNLIEEKDELSIKRQVYVAITRAKKICVLSYAKQNSSFKEIKIADILEELPSELTEKFNSEESQKIINDYGIENTVKSNRIDKDFSGIQSVVESAKEEYSKLRISVTLINNFFACPWMWYFRNFIKLPSLKSDSLMVGSIVHAVLEKTINQKGRLMEIEVIEIIDQELLKNKLENTKKGILLKEKIITIYNSWLEKRFNEISNQNETEKDVSFANKNFPHLKFYGKLDLVEYFKDKSIVVTDFKTGRVKTRNEIEKNSKEERLGDYLRQLTMYYFLMQDKGYDLNNSKFKLLFVESELDDKNGVYETFINQEQLDLLNKDFKDYDELLKSGTWIERPCFNDNKNFGGNDNECEYCSLAKKIYKI